MVGNVAGWPRPADEIALHFGHAERAHPGQLIRSLDAFRSDGHVQPGTQHGDGLDDGAGRLGLVQVPDERSIDLDLVERKYPEAAQTGKADAEVVHGNAYARVAQHAQDGERLLGALQQDGFGDLELKPVGRQAAVDQRLSDPQRSAGDA
jgi:hypothetical protein